MGDEGIHLFSFTEANITLIQEPKILHIKWENYKYRPKNLHQNMSKLNLAIYRVMHHDQVKFIPEMQSCFNSWRSMNLITISVE